MFLKILIPSEKHEGTITSSFGLSPGFKTATEDGLRRTDGPGSEEGWGWEKEYTNTLFSVSANKSEGETKNEPPQWNRRVPRSIP